MQRRIAIAAEPRCRRACCAFARRRARAAEAPPTAVFVLDGSGSMWGNLGTDKRPKFEIVREVAAQTLLPRLRPDARVGLASFGHRRAATAATRKSSCRPMPTACSA